MKKSLLTVASLIVLSSRAMAQAPQQMPEMQRESFKPGMNMPRGNMMRQVDDPRLDRKYKDALKKIPERKKTNDPWAGIRSGEPTKK
jgi:uncharacterized protein YecT (DUF1311 family)